MSLGAFQAVFVNTHEEQSRKVLCLSQVTSPIHIPACEPLLCPPGSPPALAMSVSLVLDTFGFCCTGKLLPAPSSWLFCCIPTRFCTARPAPLPCRRAGVEQLGEAGWAPPPHTARGGKAPPEPQTLKKDHLLGLSRAFPLIFLVSVAPCLDALLPGAGSTPVSWAGESFLSPNVNKKLPAVEMIPFSFRARRNHHSSPLTSSSVGMETEPSGSQAVEYPGISRRISSPSRRARGWGHRGDTRLTAPCRAPEPPWPPGRAVAGSAVGARLWEGASCTQPGSLRGASSPGRPPASSPQPQFPVGIGLHEACPVVSLFISPV